MSRLISHWIQFAKDHQHEFTSNDNIASLPTNHLFIINNNSDYLIVFNNGYFTLYYKLAFFKGKMHINGPYKIFTDGISNKITLQDIKEYYETPEEAYTAIKNYQNSIDFYVMGYIINYTPYNGGHLDNLVFELETLNNPIIYGKTLSLSEAQTIMQKLTETGIILCFIDENIMDACWALCYVITSTQIYIVFPSGLIAWNNLNFNFTLKNKTNVLLFNIHRKRKWIK